MLAEFQFSSAKPGKRKILPCAAKMHIRLIKPKGVKGRMQGFKMITSN